MRSVNVTLKEPVPCNKQGEAWDQDVIYVDGVKVGFCKHRAGAPFVGIEHMYREQHLDAIRYLLDERDRIKYGGEPGGYPERKVVNGVDKRRLAAAVEEMKRPKNQREIRDQREYVKSLYVPESY